MEWREWCRLCARSEQQNIDLSADPDMISISTAIGKYFWVNIKSIDANKCICQDCYTLVNLLVKFTERVNKVQAMFLMLQNAKTGHTLEPFEVRAQFDLYDDDWEHIIKNERKKIEVIYEQEIETEIAEVDDDDQMQLGHYEITECNEKVDDVVEAKPKAETMEIIIDEVNQADNLANFKPLALDVNEFSVERCEVTSPRDNEKQTHNAVDKESQEEKTASENTSKYICKSCGKHCKTAISYRKHVESCVSEFRCKTCDLRYEDAATLRKHEEGHITEFYSCRFCGKHYKNASSYREHLEIHNSEKYSCKSCGESYEDAVSFGKHMESHNLETSETEEEMADAQNAQNFTCTPCGKHYNNAISYHKHLESHNLNIEIRDQSQVEQDDTHNTPKYTCKSCGKHYKNATSYRKHLESHNLESDLPDFMCDECGKVLATERQLKQHKRTHLPLEEKLTVQCTQCDKKYINEAVMKQHVIDMHTEQSYICEECGMTLKRLSSLRDHKLTHTNILAFKCETCNKGFKNKARLKAHMDAVHSTTTYQCDQCDVKLNSKRTLKMHMLVHTNEKSYKCNFCGAEFKRGKSLKNHLIIHIGLRPYKCNFCGKTFTNGSNCRAHKKKIHPQELEAEEAAGLKNQGTIVPNLYELRASESIQEPRSSIRNRGGITPKMRALLVAAEQLDESNTKQVSTSNMAQDNSTSKSIQHFKFDNESSQFQVVTELVAENDDSECFESQEIEGETLVFEVIDAEEDDL